MRNFYGADIKLICFKNFQHKYNIPCIILLLPHINTLKNWRFKFIYINNFFWNSRSLFWIITLKTGLRKTFLSTWTLPPLPLFVHMVYGCRLMQFFWSHRYIYNITLQKCISYLKEMAFSLAAMFPFSEIKVTIANYLQTKWKTSFNTLEKLCFGDQIADIVWPHKNLMNHLHSSGCSKLNSFEILGVILRSINFWPPFLQRL